ncbi:uncharacterized protein [Battus philenor]|uniref:uncharacterized protein n=1 Tax=Battus philenor TaxID=42288 RepID=UPI0035D08B2E
MKMEIDRIENIIGRFGLYQSWVLFLVTISRYPIEFQLTNVVFILPNVNYICLDEQAANASNYCPCENPEYDTSVIVSSVTSTWNLICGRTQLASLTQSLLQIGILFGSLIYGYISDRFGRKNASCLSFTTCVIFAAVSAVVPEIWMFLICRFLIGTSVGGTMLCTYVLMMELSGKSFRPFLIGLFEISYITGYFSLPIIAYFVREWRYLQLVTSVPWVFVILTYWLLPESPRWLITISKKKEAIDILTTIAKRNGRPIGDIKSIVDEIEKESLKERQIEYGSYFDLFKTTKIRIYTIIIALIWFGCAHTFFGVNQYIGRLQGNLYLNVMLSAACLLPGLLLVVLASLYLKRKVGVIISFATAAVSLIVFIFIPDESESAALAFAIIGQIGAYTAFTQVYLYSSEIFPTIVRNSAMGFASMFARFGSFIAPFVVNIGIEWVSIIIFSILAFCAGFLCLFLPETKNTVLLNTIEETENSNNKDYTHTRTIFKTCVKFEECVVKRYCDVLLYKETEEYVCLNLKKKIKIIWPKMSTDDTIQQIIGEFGKYQTWILFLIIIGRYPTDFQLTNVVYILPSVDYVCLDKEALNVTNYCPCDNPKYDTSNIVESVTSTWNLICNKTHLASLAQSMLQIGILVGSVIYGHLSDRYGRQIATLCGMITNVIFIILSAVVPQFWMFLICRFLIGTAVGGTMLCCYILMIELSGKSFRPYLTALTEIAYVTTCVIHPIIAFYVREWRYLQLITSIPWIFVIIYVWLLPESPRWLITKGKYKEATDVLTKIAKWNNKPTENISTILDEFKEKSSPDDQYKHGSYLDLFKTPKIRIYTFIIGYAWFCCSHTFFGINQYIGRLQGNFYLNIILSGISFLPSMVLNVLISLYLERKVGTIACFLLAAVSLTVFMFIPSGADITSLVLAAIGQMGAYMAFVQMYLYTSEVFPTVVRNSAMGFASMFARIGGFAAPFVVNIGIQWASIAIFSVVALTAGLSCLFLPNTKDTVLLNTIEETEKSNGKITH